MTPGMIVRAWNGKDGKITVPFLGAVIGQISSWQLARSEESGLGTPSWTLRAVLSYVNETMMKSDTIDKHFSLVLTKDKKIEICSFDSLRLEGASLIVEGVVQCQQ